jgi:imidazoleglycerol-phosphate dehydratase/histidinol-phosphatase
MKRIIFLDRDGTLIDEPIDNFQVDSFEKLAFKPNVINALQRLMQSGFELVIVSNQDGLGTEIFPYEQFLKPHNLMLDIFKTQGIVFSDVFIDPSYETENSPNRKPGIGMLSKFLSSDYDLQNSWVIGDRPTDVEMAKRLGSKAVLFLENYDNNHFPVDILTMISNDWLSIADLISSGNLYQKSRVTKETSVEISLFPGLFNYRKIQTGMGFLDHMLEQFSFYSALGLEVTCKGDLQVDQHHSIEDVAIVLGESIYALWSSRQPLQRYGFSLPMDESAAMVLLDFSGRPWLHWDVAFQQSMLGDFPTQMFRHFFYSLAINGKFTLHIEAKGDNDHHKIEAVFKAFGRAFRQAIALDSKSTGVCSTKGMI